MSSERDEKSFNQRIPSKDAHMKPSAVEPASLSRSQRRRRDDIIQAALKIFDRDGFDAARMADIASEAEVAKGTLYLYFDTKFALLEGVISSAVIPSLQQVSDTLDTYQGSARDLLAEQIRIIARRQASPEMKMLIRIILSAPEQHRSVIEFFHQNVIKEGLTLVQKTLRLGVESGEFKEEVANMDPIIFVGAHAYLAVWSNLFEDESALDVTALIDNYMGAVFNGIIR